MGQRFSRIKNGAEYNAALTRYITYLQGTATRPKKINTRGPQNLNKTAFIIPFTAEVGTARLQVRAGQADYDLLSPYILASSKADISDVTAATVASLPKFSASRISYMRNTTRVVSVATSEITGIQYLKYAGDTFSCPFGAQTDADDEMEAFLDIKQAILTAQTTFAIKRVSLKREKVGVERA